MTRLFILFFCCFTYNLHAQVYTTHIFKDGSVNKYVRVQTGKDTVVVGVPYHAFEKLGTTLSIKRTKDVNLLTFDLRSNNPKVTDSLTDILKASLVFTMTDGTVFSIKSKNGNHSQIPKLKGAVGVFIQNYLSSDQMAILTKKKVAAIAFCIEDGNCIDIDITRTELRKIRSALSYLAN